MTESQFDNPDREPDREPDRDPDREPDDRPEGEPKLPRVTVSHPMTRAAAGASGLGSSNALRVDARQPGNDMALRSIMRAQLRLALRWFAVLVAMFVSVVALLVLTPRSVSFRILGAPFVWVLLGVLCFPMLALIAHQYVKRVERLERRILSLTDLRSLDRPEVG